MWTLIVVASAGDANSSYSEWMVDDETDIEVANQPDFQKEFGFTPAPGSVAYLNEDAAGGVALEILWMKSRSGHWNELS